MTDLIEADWAEICEKHLWEPCRDGATGWEHVIATVASSGICIICDAHVQITDRGYRSIHTIKEWP